MRTTTTCPGIVLAAALCCTTAHAAIPDSLHDTAHCAAHTEAPLNYLFCDDGVPSAGGTTPNTGGVAAITVPAEYHGDGHTGLPPRKTPTTVPGADAEGNVALDVDISWPLTPPPPGGYPLLFFMHGCCGGNKTSWEAADFGGGEKWQYNNAWFASRGYVVVNYTARGFATNGPAGPNRAGSTGETQLDSRRYEINDYQSLACQIYASASRWNTATGQTVRINPEAVVVTGGSYGGGFSWMALTDPIWSCNADTGADGQRMKLAAVAPRYGWTDLVHSLVPTGRHSSSPGALPQTDGCDSGGLRFDGSACADAAPVGIPKQSINAGLYGTGLVGTTFPPLITETQACLNSVYPVENNPQCANIIATALTEFLADRSAYYQNHWFDRIATDPEYRIPVFSAGALTDPLFPPVEHRRMHNRVLARVPGYPLQAYFGDYQHFVQNKAKEWADICGDDHHVCTNEDYAGNFNTAPSTLVRMGVTKRLNRFIDHYAKPASNPSQAAPSFDVTAALQVCPAKADTLGVPADEPGTTFTASNFEALASGRRVFDSSASPPTLAAGSAGTNTVSTVSNALHADPVLVSQMSDKCPMRLADDPAPPGVVQFTSDALTEDLVMLGATRVIVAFSASGDTASVQLHARLYELLPSGDAVMADRGYRRLSSAEVEAGAIGFELFGNGWQFSQGNRIRLELTQDDSPYLKTSQPPSGLAISHASMTMPVRSSAVRPPVTGGGARHGGGALGLGLIAVLLLALGALRRVR